MKESNRDVTQTCILYFLFDCDDNFSPIIPGCQSAVMITLVQVSQRLIVGHWSLIIIILLDPEFEIFPFEVVRAIIVLLWFFFSCIYLYWLSDSSTWSYYIPLKWMTNCKYYSPPLRWIIVQYFDSSSPISFQASPLILPRFILF